MRTRLIAAGAAALLAVAPHAGAHAQELTSTQDISNSGW